MGHCKDCKHWGFSKLSPNQGECELFSHCGKCTPQGHDIPDPPVLIALHLTRKAFIFTGQDSGGVFITNADFGCVQFTPKEA